MTEAEWLACADTLQMVTFIRGKVSDRKLRQFAVHCFQHLGPRVSDRRQQRAIEVLEGMAEGTGTTEARREGTRYARQALPPFVAAADTTPADDPYFIALMLYRELASSSAGVHAATVTAGLADGATEQMWQGRVLREILGNPFRPVSVDPRWLTSPVLDLARMMYDTRDFGPMPILADALEEAGCDNADVLAHCRGGGPHVRGCWVVDLVLGKA